MGENVQPIRLLPRGDARPPRAFHRGAHAPYATRWFGATMLAGHARNLVASAIAAESIDARDWMRPSAPEELLAEIARTLGGDEAKATLVEAVGRPLWVDFVADTGDDRDVSLAVARMVAGTYVVDEAGTARVLPRGDVLLFGGDTAYPVATGEEMARRLVAPFNEAFKECVDGAPGKRVLLGIPGNHDWYDGLDGFARLFRRKPREARVEDEPARPAARRPRVKREAGIVARQLHLDEVSGIVGMFAAVGRGLKALVTGSNVRRPGRLTLLGYEPVQDASYWILPLAPGLDAWGVDRQLGRLDYRQRLFFQERRRATSEGRIVFVAPDPALAYGEPHEPGARMLGGCRLAMDRDAVFYLTGDVHHYERRAVAAASLHVIAGGGGAFLHGTRVSPSPGGPAECAYPSAAASRRLLLQVPFKLMAGSSGFLVHLTLALLASLEMGASARGTTSLVVVGCVVAAGVAAVLYANVGHNKAHPLAVGAVALPFGAVLGLLPMALRLALPHVVPVIDWEIGVLVVHAFVGAFVLGLFFAVIALLGFEHQHAFAVLSHPGFKHFVRMCIHADGRVEAWTIGKDDPVAQGEPVLVDRFEW
jgi:hypothetical protein